MQTWQVRLWWMSTLCAYNCVPTTLHVKWGFCTVVPMGDSSSITRAMSTHNGSKNVSQLTLLSHPSGNVGNKYFGCNLLSMTVWKVRTDWILCKPIRLHSFKSMTSWPLWLYIVEFSLYDLIVQHIEKHNSLPPHYLLFLESDFFPLSGKYVNLDSLHK